MSAPHSWGVLKLKKNAKSSDALAIELSAGHGHSGKHSRPLALLSHNLKEHDKTEANAQDYDLERFSSSHSLSKTAFTFVSITNLNLPAT
ncbi:hypothetical protein JQS35_11065 [Alcaligenes faecalis subsp. faecalis]|uniref:hypothetical protein n=1 Tax=Alcaligenes faecalis TaxID=511 RepID=UPI001F1FFEE2|nr:hypothetical protein [Alcaligenes faecalis]MBW4789139.1 hypothetical protein [Alcaligenes faecalis subsp. faecalis]